MTKIDPHSFYDHNELEEILRGRVKVETLRQFGLVGLSRGYWGQNIIDALSKFCNHLSRQRGVREKEDDHEFFEKRKEYLQRSERKKVQPFSDESQKMETQRQKLERLAKKVVDSG